MRIGKEWRHRGDVSYRYRIEVVGGRGRGGPTSRRGNGEGGPSLKAGAEVFASTLACIVRRPYVYVEYIRRTMDSTQGVPNTKEARRARRLELAQVWEALHPLKPIYLVLILYILPTMARTSRLCPLSAPPSA